MVPQGGDTQLFGGWVQQAALPYADLPDTANVLGISIDVVAAMS
jgi:hypothetical protein